MKKIAVIGVCFMFFLTACSHSAVQSVNTGSNCETHSLDYSKYKVLEEATCAREGLKIIPCKYCDYEEKVILPVKEHKKIEISNTATCTEAGKAIFECSVCNNTFENDTNALGHKWIGATCQKAKYCSVCNATEGGTVSHSFSGSFCSVCGVENVKAISCQGVNFIVPNEVTVEWLDTKTKIYDITISYDTVYDSYSRFIVNYSAQCISKGQVGGNGFAYSLYDEEGYVVDSGSRFSDELKAGEKTRNQSFGFELPHTSGDLEQGKTYKLVIDDM